DLERRHHYVAPTAWTIPRISSCRFHHFQFRRNGTECYGWQFELQQPERSRREAAIKGYFCDRFLRVVQTDRTRFLDERDGYRAGKENFAIRPYAAFRCGGQLFIACRTRQSA